MLILTNEEIGYFSESILQKKWVTSFFPKSEDETISLDSLILNKKTAL